MEGEGIADRISTLPEGILHHILSFLPTDQAVPTASTCKRLNQVWNTLPCFDLGPHLIPVLPKYYLWDEQDCDGGDDDEEIKFTEFETTDGLPNPTPFLIEFAKNLKEIKTKRERLFTFVEQSLTRRRMQGLTIQKFKVQLRRMDVEISQHLDRWIRYLVDCNIKELVLQVGVHCYDVPPILFTASSLCALTLERCQMLSPGSITTLSPLRKLHLSSCFLDDKIMRDIMNTCCNLEEFYIHHCHGVRRIIVSGLPQLKVLNVIPHIHEVTEQFVVEAMNLDALSYILAARLPCEFNIITGGNMKDLCLSGVDITDTWLYSLISKLPHLEELSLGKLNMKSIKISSSSLKRLTLTNLFDFKGSAVSGEVAVDIPNLVYFSYTGCLSIVFLTKLGVKDVQLQLDDIVKDDSPEELCSKLMRLLQIFDFSGTVKLNCTYFEDIAFPVNLNIIAPLAHVKHLILEGRFKTSLWNVLGDLIYSMLRVSPNLDTLTLKDNYCDDDAYPIDLVIKFDSELRGNGDCITLPWRCQRNCITHMNVNLKSTGDAVGNFGHLKKYFMHNTVLIEEIIGHYCKT